MYVVVSAAPFHFTAEPFMKLFPDKVNVNPNEPAMADEGEIEFKTGTGLLTTLVSGVVKS